MANTNVINETKELDAKKKETNSIVPNISANNIMSFIYSLVKIILLIIVYFIFGSIVLYECKLAQSNIVPTNLECYPYTNSYPEIKQILTNIFITNTDPQESVKLSFPYNEANSSNSFLEMFRSYKENPSATSFLIYMISILEGVINYSNNSITTFFNFLNNIPEILIVLLGPIISLFYFIISPLIGILVFCYYYFSEMGWLFKTNTNTNENSKPIWSDLNFLNPTGYISSFFLAGVFFILFWILLFTVAPFVPILIFYVCLFMTFGYTGEINNKSATMGTIIKETFKNYKVTISTVLSIFIVLSTFTNLGVIPGVFSLFTVLLISFNFIKLNIFESNVPSNLSPLTSSKQAIKKCTLGKPKTILSQVTNLFKNVNGDKIGSELKKLGTKLGTKLATKLDTKLATNLDTKLATKLGTNFIKK